MSILISATHVQMSLESLFRSCPCLYERFHHIDVILSQSNKDCSIIDISWNRKSLLHYQRLQCWEMRLQSSSQLSE